ncbi:bifunctional 4-hydroxy-2-oxoglutarate aldolase/2-dehydro-3-deoxy-phosphogluconate aldolase [Thiovibrio frasassiensis]|uniref:Bifunctional 4-hydroxy-2-oxoglutarate aldolase/2-dehydro-3-deoxy-phosphogluconate aldolase n=1 Tax=Thiovibrio frasassiensis TaxID=2984131 RepID=A0A9X4MEC1_9BACT|nr:bifunctional 4-hydroxy-2-oxoglutarate aldolase/2-dehydro-3-deoxy-phosphogluconate aldolase [Thiovibrio frasassiensis]MDG4475017.1 bifunctional 4-hydroxy-2-oxoglutarate aldolase/2-dehydro-3-deoxy-phosphogluconate aldolase [Thiovibrio frasassiensis]
MELDVSVIGILRGVAGDFFGEAMQISFAGGLTAMEVTMNTPDAEKIVREYRSAVPAGKLLGMGTIRNLEEAIRAVAAGAMFLVTPNLDTKVIEYAKAEGVPIVAGALTPTEVYTAWSAGADLVKVFPCGAMGGPQYIKDLLGPFDHLRLAAVGGVSLANLPEYFKAGAAAVGVSTSLFGAKALREKNLDQIGQNVKIFIEHCREAKDRV